MKKIVAFVCVHNSCRSQMAEGWAKKLGSDFWKLTLPVQKNTMK